MKLKYTYFANREEYDEAYASGEQVTWSLCDVDNDSVEGFAEYMENILIDDSAAEYGEYAEEIHILVIDRYGTSSDDFREYSAHKGCDQLDYASILTYFAETREKDMQELVSLAWKEYEHLYEKLCLFFHVYEVYHAEVRGHLSDDAAVDAALNSTNGVREVIYSKEPLKVTLKKDVWKGKTGSVTTVDCFWEM